MHTTFGSSMQLEAYLLIGWHEDHNFSVLLKFQHVYTSLNPEMLQYSKLSAF